MTGPTIEAAFPLTPLQEGMLYHTVRAPQAGLFHVQCRADLEGPLVRDHLRRAWELAVARHGALRTFFSWQGRERPLQVVQTTAPVAMEFLDWSSDPADSHDSQWVDLLAQDRDSPLDLSVAPMMRLRLVRLGRERHRQLWSVHHAIVDGWSGHLVLDELVRDYNLLARGQEPMVAPTPRFDQFVGWVGAQDVARDAAHWRRVVGGRTEATALPGAGRGRSLRGERLYAMHLLSPEATQSLREVAVRLGVTVNTLLMGAWGLLLGRYADDDAVCMGVTATERPSVIPDVGRAAGLYLTTVPVQAPTTRGASIRAWLRDLQLAFGEALAHGAPGLAAIRQWSGHPAGSPLFDNLVVFENFPPAAVRRTGAGERVPGDLLRLSLVDSGVPSDVPLVLLAHPGEQLRLDVIHDPKAVPDALAGQIPGILATILSGFSGDPDRPVEALSWDDPAARRELLESWSGAGVQAPVASDVCDRFEAQADHRPDAIALQTAAESMSYGELNRHANRLAQRLRAAGAREGMLVGVLADRSPIAITALFACLKAGVAFVVLDPEVPAARLHRLMLAMDLVLVTPPLADRLPAGREAVILDAADTLAEVAPPRSTRATDIAYVVFTSGSTGEPKGVVVERGHLGASNAARDQYYAEPPAAFLLLSSLSVDSAFAGIFWTLGTGGTLVLPPRFAEQDLALLAELIKNRGVSHTLLVPSLYRTMLELADSRQLASLRCVIVAGEACQAETVLLHRSRLPGVSLHNEYGPSEATIWATAGELVASAGASAGATDAVVTIGRPIPGVSVYLLDSRLQPVPKGGIGEICLGGCTVARGYLGQPEETAERFVPDPFRVDGRLYRTGDRGRFLPDGRLEFLGRRDAQLKVRGFRVEPMEVEQALQAYPGVREAAVGLVSRRVAPTPEGLLEALAALPDGVAERLVRGVEVLS